MKELTIRKIRRIDEPALLNFRNDPTFIEFCTNRKYSVTLEEFSRELELDFSKDRQVQFIVELDNIPIGTLP